MVKSDNIGDEGAGLSSLSRTLVHTIIISSSLPFIMKMLMLSILLALLWDGVTPGSLGIQAGLGKRNNIKACPEHTKEKPLKQKDIFSSSQRVSCEL